MANGILILKTISVAASAVAGNNAIWTPTAGFKFRLLGFQITGQGLAATATGVITLSFADGASGLAIGTYDIDFPAVAGVVTGITQISGGLIVLPSSGILSATVNNVLNLVTPAPLAGAVGTYRVSTVGLEE